jgi:zinc transporter ZupT
MKYFFLILGDYAVLIQSGFSHYRALFWNFLSATTAFIGFFIGVALSTDDKIRQWIFAVTVGMFLYIALVDLVCFEKQ